MRCAPLDHLRRARPRPPAARCRGTSRGSPALLRIAIEREEMVVVGLAEHIARVRKRRHPAAVVEPRVPADMVDMQMRAHHHVDLLRPHAGRGEALEIGRVELVPDRPLRARLVVADAGVDQDSSPADLDQPECTLSLIQPLAGSKWFGTIQRRCSATISSRQSAKKVFASKIRLVAFLDARDLRRADGRRGHANACVQS